MGAKNTPTTNKVSAKTTLSVKKYTYYKKIYLLQIKVSSVKKAPSVTKALSV